MSYHRVDTERERLLGSSRMGIDSAINDGNDVMIDDLTEKTSHLLTLTKTVYNTMNADEALRGSLTESIYRSEGMMSKGSQYLSNVTNDPTYFGVFKIAMLVFISLCTIYFGGKFICRFLLN